MNKELKHLTDIVIKYINAMSNRDVSYSNVNFLFKRDGRLQILATGHINTLEDADIDSRDLSIAFSNSFSDLERCADDVEGTLENGKYILDVPQIVIERAMHWLTEQAITDSPYNAKIKRGVPQAALKSNSAFDEFLRGK
jgi:hypothetical protein